MGEGCEEAAGCWGQLQAWGPTQGPLDASSWASLCFPSPASPAVWIIPWPFVTHQLALHIGPPGTQRTGHLTQYFTLLQAIPSHSQLTDMSCHVHGVHVEAGDWPAGVGFSFFHISFLTCSHPIKHAWQKTSLATKASCQTPFLNCKGNCQALRRQRKENCDLEASLGYAARTNHNKEKHTKKKKTKNNKTKQTTRIKNNKTRTP